MTEDDKADMRALLDAALIPIRARLDGLPLIGSAIDVLQRDVRLVRAAINDMGRTNITAGEVEAMHTDIDRVLAENRELAGKVATLERQMVELQRRDPERRQ